MGSVQLSPQLATESHRYANKMHWWTWVASTWSLRPDVALEVTHSGEVRRELCALPGTQAGGGEGRLQVWPPLGNTPVSSRPTPAAVCDPLPHTLVLLRQQSLLSGLLRRGDVQYHPY